MNSLNEINNIDLTQFFQKNTSFANCINQLRTRHIHFLNLGNIIVCPDQECIFIFKTKLLNRIEDYKSSFSDQVSSRKLSRLPL